MVGLCRPGCIFSECRLIGLDISFLTAVQLAVVAEWIALEFEARPTRMFCTVLSSSINELFKIIDLFSSWVP